MMKQVFLAAALLFLAACNDSTTTQGDGTAAEQVGRVKLDGSSTVFPISEAVAEEFSAVQPGIRVTVGVSGTGGGFKKFLNGEIDINDASRPIKPSELAKANAAGIKFIELPVAFDGISIVVSKSNTWVDHLTVAELKMLWEPESKVKTWNDLRADWPREAIRLYGPGTDSGTFDYFTEEINGKSQASRSDFTASEDDNVLVQGISGDKNALGYFGFAYYEENQDKLKVVPIDNGAGPVAPSAETINDGRYAPLSRPIFIYVSLASLDNPAVSQFVDFYLSKAEELAREVGYIDLPADVYAKNRERLTQRVAGSAYTGDDKLSNLITKE